MKEDFQEIYMELESELNDNILHYWLQYALDEENGGFYGQIDFYNNIEETANKGSVLNTRILWSFSAAYNITKEKVYLVTAERAFAYIKEYFLDKRFGGIYWELDYKGNPRNTRKQIYALSFAIYSMSEYYKACGDEKALLIAQELFKQIEKHSFDKKNNGYIEAFTEDWIRLEDFRLSEKDANESKTMNTHLHIMEAYASLYRIWKDPQLEKALKNIILLFTDKFIDSGTHHLNLFFDDYWNLKSKEISYGHDIECSWLLYEAAEVLGDMDIMIKVRSISIQMAYATFKGVDSDGGVYNDYKILSEELDTDKHWWTQAEAMVGFFNAYQLLGDDILARKSLNSWSFIKKFIVDKEYGEWYWKVDKNGVPDENDEKAGFWKCPYHNTRACIEMITRINKVFMI